MLKTDDRRVKFHEIWDQADQEMQLSAKVMRRKRKRYDENSDSGTSDVPPPLPSPDTIVLPNQDGFDDYLKTMSQKYALDSTSWD